MSDANDLTTEMLEVTEFRQNGRNFQNRGKGISEIEGKGAMGSAERDGSRASFKPRMPADDTDVRLGAHAASRKLSFIQPRMDTNRHEWLRRCYIVKPLNR